MKRLIFPCILLLAIVVSAAGSYAQPQIHECDRLAADSGSSDKVVSGVKWGNIYASEAIAACQKAIQLFPNVSRFQYQYGRALSKGKRFKEAVKWYKLAAEQGNDVAQEVLGYMYEMGQVLQQDYEEAEKWYKLAIRQGSTSAKAQLENLQKRIGITPIQKGMIAFKRYDYANALRYLEPLAEHGNAKAQFTLATMYQQDGFGVPKDYKIAAKWHKLSAKQGHKLAQHSLGSLYYVGKGVPQNYKTAIKWYKLAAEQGLDVSKVNLGEMYANGKGVSQDYGAAINWYKSTISEGALFASKIKQLQKKISNQPSRVKSKKAFHQTKPVKQIANASKSKVRFARGPVRPDDIAVIIGNSNYKKLGKDIPNITPAYSDAENIKRYFTDALGVREGNIIHLKDATKAQLSSIFGSNDDHRGKLFNWTKPNVSKVYVYYAGHGAPAGNRRTAYLVPSDSDSDTVQLTGYPLEQLYRNLGKIPAKSVTVILEACFSGQSQNEYLFKRTSGLSLKPRMPTIPTKITVISAGAANQVASWEKDESQSLFTKYFLRGMSGEGDRQPYGNGNGKVSLKELQKYLDGTMTYYARRYYGRDQKAQIIVNGQKILADH